ncbi:hypothetical protein D4764_10G0011280 [Takifugu flavidus]|uniref:Uncharacterized protein n=1 Tax=Takifugu flavidus TaxID=433684 RepID=A0A5C6PMZ2_9TELE|nr:hypothetical protein D4764_10G0011280 [Takifugu flavidus]
MIIRLGRLTPGYFRLLQRQVAGEVQTQPQDRAVNQIAMMLAILGLGLSYYSAKQMTEKVQKHEKLEKYQGLKEEIERMWGMKATVVPVVIGTLGAVTPNLSRWFQQIPGTTSEISVQKSTVLGTAKILRRTLRLPGLW